MRMRVCTTYVVCVLGAKDHHRAFNSQQPKLIKLMNYNFLTLSHCIHIHVSSWYSAGKYEFLFHPEEFWGTNL